MRKQSLIENTENDLVEQAKDGLNNTVNLLNQFIEKAVDQVHEK